MTAHKPATPLPQLQGPMRYGSTMFEFQGDGHQIAVIKNCDLDTAKEIMRRSNAYPRLVEALLDIINDSDPGMERGIALLRELWEAK